MNNSSNDSVKVGDVFSCSWGYDQTNVDFYQVVGLTAGNKSVKVRRIQSQVMETGMMCGKAKPVVNSFVGEVITKRLKDNGFRVTSFSWAFKTDVNEEHYCSWYH